MNYIQNLRTAMGTKMAPTYDTPTFAYLEENLYEIIGKKYNRIYLIIEKIPRLLSYFGNVHGATLTIF